MTWNIQDGSGFIPRWDTSIFLSHRALPWASLKSVALRASHNLSHCFDLNKGAIFYVDFEDKRIYERVVISFSLPSCGQYSNHPLLLLTKINPTVPHLKANTRSCLTSTTKALPMPQTTITSHPIRNKQCLQLLLDSCTNGQIFNTQC